MVVARGLYLARHLFSLYSIFEFLQNNLIRKHKLELEGCLLPLKYSIFCATYVLLAAPHNICNSYQMKEAIGHKCNAILNVLIFNMKEIESQVSIKDNMIRLRKRFKVRKKQR